MVLGLAVVCCGLLAILSIFATLLPALRAPNSDVPSGLPATAAALFHSPVLAIVWIFIFMTLVASLLFVPGLWRRPAAVAMHLGALFVLGGALWGSPRGHWLAGMWAERAPWLRPWIGGDGVLKGVLVAHEGMTENRVRTTESAATPDAPEIVATLPFSVRLRDFRMEYYGPWELHAAVPVLRHDADGHAEIVYEARDLEWQLDQPLDLPESRLTVTVREFLPHTRLAWPDDVPADLCIEGPGVHVDIPALPGQRVSVPLPPVVAADPDLPWGRHASLLSGRAVMVTINQLVNTENPRRPVTPEATGTPSLALLATLEFSDGPSRPVAVTSRGPRYDDGIAFLLAPREVEIVADGAGDLPAVDVEISRPGGSLMQRIGQFLDTTGSPRGFPAPALPMHNPPAPGEGISLFLSEPPVKGFFSNVDIIESGQVVKQATIAVNDPLWHRGYHLYQMDWDKNAHAFTVLHVVNDRGLWAVWAGLALMLLGVFGKYWFAPVMGYFRRRGVQRDEGR